MTDRLLRRREVENLVGLSTSRIYCLMKTGEFPIPVRIARQAVAWRQSEIDEWIETRPRAANEPTSVPHTAIV